MRASTHILRECKFVCFARDSCSDFGATYAASIPSQTYHNIGVQTSQMPHQNFKGTGVFFTSDSLQKVLACGAQNMRNCRYAQEATINICSRSVVFMFHPKRDAGAMLKQVPENFPPLIFRNR